MKNKIVLADNRSIFSAGLKLLLEHGGEFQVVYEVGAGQSVFQVVEEYQPELLVLGPSTTGRDIGDTVGRVKQQFPGIKILALTTFKEEAYVRQALKIGAEGYILKDDTWDELLVAVRALVADKLYISPSISKQIVQGYLNQPIKSELPKVTNANWGTLTSREQEVLVLVAEGKKNKEIAGFLSLSIKTIEKHRASMMSKLNFKNTPALIYYAMENGLLTNQFSATVQ